MFGPLWCVLNETTFLEFLHGFPLFFSLYEHQALTSKASSVCRWLLSIFIIIIIIIIIIVNLLWLVRDHIPPFLPLLSGRTRSLQELHRSSQSNRSQNKKQKNKKRERKRKILPFFFLWRIWGRDLITTAGVCRHWNNNNKTHTHTHTQKKKEYQATNEYTERMTKHEGE